MKLIILSGLSGAGKSTAAKYLEDMGFYCIDNLPPQLLQALVEALGKVPGGTNPSDERYVLVMDARAVKRFGRIAPSLAALKEKNPDLRIVFLDAGDEVILSRYKQSRRNHPLAGKLTLTEAIKQERERLAPVKALATDLIDTTEMRGSDMRDLLYDLFHESDSERRMSVFIQSFGFKYGMPRDCDLVWDVRFIPNPFYRPELRNLSGLDPEVCDFIFSHPVSGEYLQKQVELLHFVLPYYEQEGKVRLNIGIGCTGGRHRSVAFTEALQKELVRLGYSVLSDHRDIKRDPQGGL